MPEICVTCFVYFLLNTVKKTKVRGSKITDLSDSQLLDMIYLFDVISILMVFALKDKFNHKTFSDYTLTLLLMESGVYFSKVCVAVFSPQQLKWMGTCFKT